jgi:hypothetical protein
MKIGANKESSATKKSSCFASIILTFKLILKQRTDKYIKLALLI